MSKIVVGSMSDWSGMLKDLFRQIDDGTIDLNHMRVFLSHQNPFPEPSELVAEMQKILSRKLDQQILVDPLPVLCTVENISLWEKYNLKLVFFPGVDIVPETMLKGYTKPAEWFYRSWRDKKIADSAVTLIRGWYLADFTNSVDYIDGAQEFLNDPFAPIITKLRQEKKAGKYDQTPMGSRFAITNDEWREVVCPAIAEELGFEPNQVHLERASEFNFIGNLYDANRGKFNAWEWFDDKFEDSNRLCGGNRDNGGLAVVHYDADYRSSSIAGRPLVSFIKSAPFRRAFVYRDFSHPPVILPISITFPSSII